MICRNQDSLYQCLLVMGENPLCSDMNVTATPYVPMLGKGWVSVQILDSLQFSETIIYHYSKTNMVGEIVMPFGDYTIDTSLE